MKRLTLDLDDCSYQYAKYRVRQLMEMGADKVFLRKSSGGEGYHVEAWIEDWDRNEYMTRALLGDDPLRLWKDIQQTRLGVPSTQVLFNTKEGRDAGSWEVFRKV